MGGSSTSTQQVTVPADVLARYNAVNTRAEETANRPFTPYSTDPNAFVAGLNPTQQAGIANTNVAATMAQPFYGQATNQLMGAQQAAVPFYGSAAQLNMRGAQAISPNQIANAMSPYLGTVLQGTAALQNQMNQQAMSGQLGNAIRQGAFGGDRAGIAAANLAQQQQLASNKTFADILNQGYGQGVSLAQSDRAALQQAAQQQAALGQGLYGIGSSTSQQLAALGQGAQNAGLAGAQAQLAAGQAAQQTEQAGRTALYNQFLQQQSYPFQVAQFLGNIAMGTGSLSGSTTTTNQPGGLFSDRRLKENAQIIGKTFDGQPIYKFNYKGDNTTQIGLMAQNVEKHHPDAVGLAGGYKTVNYDKATQDAAKRGHFASGGYASAGGGVMPQHAGEGFADGGYAGFDPQIMQQILSSYQQMYAPMGGLGAAEGTMTGMGRNIPAQAMAPHSLMIAGDLPKQASGVDQVKGLVDTATEFEDLGGDVKDFFKKHSKDAAKARGGLAGYAVGGAMPYEKQISGPQLDIPEEDPNDKNQGLQKPGQLGKPRGALDDVKDVVDIVSKVIPFLATGGKVDEEDEAQDPMQLDMDEMKDIKPDISERVLRQLREQIEASSKPADIRASEESSSDESGLGALAGSSAHFKNAEEDNTGLSPATSPLAIRNGPGPRSVRNNNPGNIEDSAFARKLPGYAGSDGRFAVFKDPEAGRAAQVGLINSYISRGYDTPFEIANRWAPGTEKGNNPNSYAKTIADKLGIGIHDRVSPKDADQIASAQTFVEGGSKALKHFGLRFSTGGYADGGSPDEEEKRKEAGKFVIPDELKAQAENELKGGLAGVSDIAAPAPAKLAAPTTPGLAPVEKVARVPDTTPSQTTPTPTGDYINKMPYMMTPEGIAAATQNMPDYYGAGPEEQGSFVKNLLHGKGRKQTDALLTLLSGIGTAAAAPTRNPLTAILAGLGAGAGTYQQMRNYELQRAKTAQELAQRNRTLGLTGTEVGLLAGQFPYGVGQTLANIGLTGAQTQRTSALIAPEVQEALARAGLLKNQSLQALAATNEIQTVPDGQGGANLILTSKVNGAIKVIPVPSFGNTGGTTGAPATPSPAAPAPAAPTTTAPTTPTAQPKAPKAAQPASAGWRPITDVEKTDIPSSYYLLGPAVLEPQRTHDAQVMSHQEDSARSASTAQLQLNQLNQQFKNLNPQGFLAPGLAANTRTQVVRAANAFLNSFGLPPMGDTSSAENLQKLTNTLGIGLTRSLGQRESGQVLNLAINSNPGIENSPMAFRRLITSMNMEAQRQKDMAEFYKNYSAKTGGILRGAREMFDRLNPPQKYAARAVMQTVDPRDAADIRKNRSNPAAIQAFDRKYGKGVSSYFVR